MTGFKKCDFVLNGKRYGGISLLNIILILLIILIAAGGVIGYQRMVLPKMENAAKEIAEYKGKLADKNNQYEVCSRNLTEKGVQFEECKTQTAILQKTNEEKTEDIVELSAQLESLKVSLKKIRNEEKELYKTAVLHMEQKEYDVAKKKLARLLELYPATNLKPDIEKAFKNIENALVEIELARKPPIKITKTKVEKGDFIYSKARIYYESLASRSIDKIYFKILLFDEEGYPVNAEYEEHNYVNAYSQTNLHPNKKDYGIWNVPLGVKKIKARVRKVDFFEGEDWEDPDLESWIAKEKSKCE